MVKSGVRVYRQGYNFGNVMKVWNLCKSSEMGKEVWDEGNNFGCSRCLKVKAMKRRLPLLSIDDSNGGIIVSLWQVHFARSA